MMSTSLRILFAVILSTFMIGVSLITGKEDFWQFNVDECGVTKGCFRLPSDCTESNCIYFLMWQKIGTDAINFEFAVQLKLSTETPWAAFGVSDKNEMPGASVVDCIVNGSDNNRVVVQMSHNVDPPDHNNEALNNRYLGLVKESLQGAYVSPRIYCNFTRLKTVNHSEPDGSKVRDLTVPLYVLFATGPTDGHGVKQKHDFIGTTDPFVSDSKIDFNNYTNHTAPVGSGRSAYIRTHVTLMIVAWMVLASLAMIVSRYMKDQWKENGAIGGKPIWFQIHRFSMGFVFLLTLIGIIVIFKKVNWTFLLPDLHPLLGFIVGCLVLLNLCAGLFRPHLYSPYRPIFRYFHMILGHGTHLLAVVTMYFGVDQPQAMMAFWTKYVVIGFGVWRLLSDVILTCTRLQFQDKPIDYVAMANNSTDETTDKMAGWRCAILIVYMIGVFVIALTLIIAANVPYY